MNIGWYIPITHLAFATNSTEIKKVYVMLSRETLDAINQLAKEKYKELKNDKFGIDEKENNADTEAIKAELSEYLGK